MHITLVLHASCAVLHWSPECCLRSYADAGDAKEPYKYLYKQQDDPFSFEIIRTGGQPRQEPIWNTTGHRLIFKEQYLEISSWAPARSHMYGLGERISSSGRHSSCFSPVCTLCCTPD